VQERAQRLDRSRFFGVPIAGFENAGRQQLIFLLMCGLEPRSKVLDIGCGVLRAGYWLMHFLDPHGYHGIEPNRERLDMGRRLILEPDLERTKHPRFDTNANFDSGVFAFRRRVRGEGTLRGSRDVRERMPSRRFYGGRAV